MSIKEQIQIKLDLLSQEKANLDQALLKLEEEFADVKLNPYGITSIDFSKRQELTADSLKMEGAVMGLTLALEMLNESKGND